MSGGPNGAKRLLERPLGGGVGRHCVRWLPWLWRVIGRSEDMKAVFHEAKVVRLAPSYKN